MPRYEYRCRVCGSTFEVSRPMAESSAPADSNFTVSSWPEGQSAGADD
ncbi:zinc ribbon domain-containing protein, partial [Streptomyces sp. MBT65]